MLTEQQNPRTQNIDRLSTLEMLEVINSEDATVAEAVKRSLPAIAQAVDAIASGIKQGGRLIYVGAGTSGRLGVLDAVECVPTFSASPDLVVGLIAGGDSALTRSVEGAEDNAQQGRADVLALNLAAWDSVVGIAASGKTPYVIGAIEAANEVGATTVALSCNDPAPLLDVSQIAIGVPVGAEVITGSTRMKAGTAQKMVLNMLSTAAMVKLGKVYGNLMVDVQVTNNKLADRACRMLSQITGVDHEESGRLLRQSDNSVKVAAVMYFKQVSAEEARQLLQAVNGSLYEILG